ncbi:MAG: AMP-dependent synthetase/ligase [Candidatus Aminicenantia bacterium]
MELKTIKDIFYRATHQFNKENHIMFKKEGKYHGISTKEFHDTIKFITLGLISIGLKNGDKVSLISETRYEWTFLDFSIIIAGGVTVPIYPTLNPEQIKYIIENSDSKMVIFSDVNQWKKLEMIKKELPNVTHYITFLEEAPSDEVITLKNLIEMGKTYEKENQETFDKKLKEGNEEDLLTIIYTSGTIGVPKGVMLSHRNLISNVTAVEKVLHLSEKDTTLSFLPLAHVLERMVTFAYFYFGCSVAYAESVDTVGENLVEIKPTIVVAVPRLFEKIYARVIDNVLSSPPLRQKIFFWALKVGREYGEKILNKKTVPLFLKIKRSIADKLVYSKIRSRTGGRIRFFVSGGAPLSKEIAEFFFALGIKILEGYGLTETSPVVAVNTEERIKFGSVGPLLPGVEVKIADDGEILVRGPNVMIGYYKNESETKEVIKDGWFHTGDIGKLDDDGFLYITDRKKELLVTSGGKNIAPQPIENMIKTSPYVNQVVCIGDKRKFISALIVPNWEKLEEQAKNMGILFSSRSELTKNKEILDFMLKEVDSVTPGLAQFEKVKKIALLEKEFTIEGGEITPTLKVKRRVIDQKYKDIIDELYEE